MADRDDRDSKPNHTEKNPDSAMVDIWSRLSKISGDAVKVKIVKPGPGGKFKFVRGAIISK